MDALEDGEDVGEFGGSGGVGAGFAEGVVEEIEPAVEDVFGAGEAVGGGLVGHAGAAPAADTGDPGGRGNVFQEGAEEMGVVGKWVEIPGI